MRPPQVRERKAQLARLETLDMGKPIAEAEWDLDDVAGCFDYYAGQPRCVGVPLGASGSGGRALQLRCAPSQPGPLAGHAALPSKHAAPCGCPTASSHLLLLLPRPLPPGLAEQLDGRQGEAVDLGSEDFRCALRREPLGVVVSGLPAQRTGRRMS